MPKFAKIPATDWQTINPDNLSDNSRKLYDAIKAANKALYESDLAKAVTTAKEAFVAGASDELIVAGKLNANTFAKFGFGYNLSIAGKPTSNEQGEVTGRDFNAYAEPRVKSPKAKATAKSTFDPFAPAKLYTKANTGAMTPKCEPTSEVVAMPAKARHAR